MECAEFLFEFWHQDPADDFSQDVVDHFKSCVACQEAIVAETRGKDDDPLQVQGMIRELRETLANPAPSLTRFLE